MTTKVNHENGLHPNSVVVQIPRDQIYRHDDASTSTPNDHDEKGKQKGQHRCRLCCLRFFVAVAGLYIIFTLISISLASGSPNSKAARTFAKPDPLPEFAVNQLVVVMNPGILTGILKPEYLFNISVNNPDENFDYQGSVKGAVLSHEGAGIAAGGLSGLLVYGEEDAATFVLELRGTYLPIDKEVEESLEGKPEKGAALRLELTFGLLATSKMMSTFLVEWNVNVSCDVEVNGLVQESQIISQKCNVDLF